MPVQYDAIVYNIFSLGALIACEGLAYPGPQHSILKTQKSSLILLPYDANNLVVLAIK